MAKNKEDAGEYTFGCRVKDVQLVVSFATIPSALMIRAI